MLIQLNGVWLTNDGTGAYSERAITSAQEVQLNGKELVQVAQYLRGAFSNPLARLNKINVLSFKTTYNFALINPSDTNPIATAELALLTYFSTAPTSGVLTICCGPIGNSAPLYAQAQNAALESFPSLDATGVRMEIAHNIQCGQLVSIPGPGANLTDQTGANLTDQLGNPLNS